MKVFKNLFGDGSKIHADEIVVGNESDYNAISNIISEKGLRIYDTRDEDWAPNDIPMPMGLRVDFKRTSTVGLTGAYYCVLVTLKPWHNRSGGVFHQVAFVNGVMYLRKSLSDWSGWEAWRRIVTQ